MAIKNAYRVFFILLVAGGLLGAKMYVSGPPPGYSGAPSEANCTSCHGGTVNTGTAQIAITIGDNLTQYVPGETYPVVVTISEGTLMRFGFEMTATNGDGAGAGVFAKIDNSTIVTAGSGQFAGRSYITHSNQGSGASSTGKRIWNFNWKAPATNVGTVKFYLATIGANNNGQNSGDRIYTRNVTLTPFVQQTNTLAITSVEPTTVCQGGTVTVGYTATGDFSANNQFTLQLSDLNGSFANPTALPTSVSDWGLVMGQIPQDFAAGSGYRLRIVSTSPVVESAPWNQPIAIQSAPQANITGLPETVCNNAGSITVMGSPVGGTFSGPGIIGNQFNPVQAGIGTHTITYSGATNCGAYQTTKTVTVTSAPEAKIINLTEDFCVNAESYQVVAEPAGGTFSGPGISTIGKFNPSLAGVGTHTIVYSGTTNCGAYQTTKTVTVTAAPDAQIGLLPQTLCQNSEPLVLQGAPAGGVFTINGQMVTEFNPALYEVGAVQINYSGAFEGCNYQTSKSITVTSPQASGISNQTTIVCKNGAPIILEGWPDGGTFSGQGVQATKFNPSVAGVGEHPVTYSGVLNGCAYTTTLIFTVKPNPEAHIVNLPESICKSALPLTLIAEPPGGTFNGIGFDNGVLMPMPPGLYTVTYSGATEFGCNYQTTQSVTVTESMQAQILNLPENVCVNSEPIILKGTPPGGTFTINGQTLEVFKPTAYGPGVYTVVYSGNAQGCAYSTSQTVTVSESVEAHILNLPDLICVNSLPFILQAEPSGGTFSGPGVENGILTNMATPGTIIISYSGTLNGCVYSTSQNTTIINPPVAQFITPQPNTKVCFGSPFQLDAWPPDGTFDGPFVDGNTFIAQEPGTYTVFYSGNAGGCDYATSTTITVAGWTDVQLVNTTNASCETCADGKAKIGLTGGIPLYSFNITPFAGTPIGDGSTYSYEHLNAGAYLVSITDACGMTDTVSFTIGVQPSSCGTPAELSVTNIQVGAVLCQWNAVPGAVTYTLRYRKTGAPNWLSLSVQTNYRTLTGLSGDASYEWTVRANCINVGAGAYAPSVVFIPNGGTPPCTRPSGLAVNQIGFSSAVVSWNPTSGVTLYQLQYRRTVGGAWITVTTAEPSYQLNDLLGSTLYTVRLSAICGNYNTTWTPSVTFQTTSGKLWADESAVETSGLFGVSLYPNPNRGFFNVSFETADERPVSLELFDLTGRAVWAREFQTESGFNEIPVNLELASGLYLLRMAGYTERIVIE